MEKYDRHKDTCMNKKEIAKVKKSREKMYV